MISTRAWEKKYRRPWYDNRHPMPDDPIDFPEDYPHWGLGNIGFAAALEGARISLYET